MLVSFLIVCAQATKPLDTLLPLKGSWAGYLEYRDYTDNSRQKIATLLRVIKPKDSTAWTFRYVYDDGPTKVLEQPLTISEDVQNKTFTVQTSEGDKSIYEIKKVTQKPDGSGTIEVFGKGEENGVIVDIRQTISYSKNKFEMLRESRDTKGKFKFRHKYSFNRVN